MIPIAAAYTISNHADQPNRHFDDTTKLCPKLYQSKRFDSMAITRSTYLYCHWQLANSNPMNLDCRGYIELH